MAKTQLEKKREMIKDSGHNSVAFNVTLMIIDIIGFTFLWISSSIFTLNDHTIQYTNLSGK